MSAFDELAQAADLWQRAHYWIDENHDAWNYMCRLASHEVYHERKFSMQWLVEQTRKKDFVKSNGTPFRGVNNSLRPALARIMAEQVPGASRWMTRQRQASVDMLER